MTGAKIAVLVSGGGTNLQALIDAQNSGIIKSGKISLVVSNNKDAYALTRAKNAGIDTAVILKSDKGCVLRTEKIKIHKAECKSQQRSQNREHDKQRSSRQDKKVSIAIFLFHSQSPL